MVRRSGDRLRHTSERGRTAHAGSGLVMHLLRTPSGSATLARDHRQLRIRGQRHSRLKLSLIVDWGDESACKPDSVLAASGGGDHPSATAVAGRLVRSTRRLGRAALERLRRRADAPSWSCSGWGLPSHPSHPGCWWSLTPPFHPYRRRTGGGLFSVALSRGSPRVGVTHHPALWSPDFPRRTSRRAAIAWPTRPKSRLTGGHRSTKPDEISVGMSLTRTPGSD